MSEMKLICMLFHKDEYCPSRKTTILCSIQNLNIFLKKTPPRKESSKWLSEGNNGCKRKLFFQPHLPLGINGFPSITVNAIDTAHVVRHRSNIVQVCCGVNLSVGVEARIQPFFFGYPIGMGKMHINILRFIHLAFIGEEDLWFRPKIMRKKKEKVL